MFEQARNPWLKDTPHCHIGREGLCTKAKGCKAEAAGLGSMFWEDRMEYDEYVYQWVLDVYDI